VTTSKQARADAMADAETLHFGREFEVARYGSTAVLVRRFTSVDRPHPGRVHRDWLDLVTSNGTELQWAPSQCRAAFRAVPGLGGE